LHPHAKNIITHVAKQQQNVSDAANRGINTLPRETDRASSFHIARCFALSVGEYRDPTVYGVVYLHVLSICKI
jgi:hypothetical protein